MQTPLYITGTSGFLGQELLRYFTGRYDGGVTGVARRGLPEGGEGLRQIVTEALLQPDWLAPGDRSATVLHCAGLSTARTPFESYADLSAGEIVPQVAMTEALVAQGWQGHLVYFSSAAVYGDAEHLPIPEDAPLQAKGYYALQKIAIEAALSFLAEQHGFRLTILRIANPYGGRHPRAERGVIRLLIEAALSEGPFTINGSGESLRDYLHMSDFLEMLARVVERPLPGPVTRLNIASGTGTSLNDLIPLVEEATGRNIDLRRQPSTLEVGSSVLDTARARALLGYTPQTGLLQGLQEMVARW